MKANLIIDLHAQALPATIGCGPHFLNSNGQLHKRGSATQILSRVTADDYLRFL
jgi:hypothetical protein